MAYGDQPLSDFPETEVSKRIKESQKADMARREAEKRKANEIGWGLKREEEERRRSS